MVVTIDEPSQKCWQSAGERSRRASNDLLVKFAQGWKQNGHQLLRCEPKRQLDARSFQFGMTSPPTAPHTVHTMRGPHDALISARR